MLRRDVLAAAGGVLGAAWHPGAMPASLDPLSEERMKTKPLLTLQDVKKIVAACEAEAAAHQWPMSIAICDDGGHTLWVQRLDGAPPATAPIAIEKARTAALIRRPTKAFEDLINNGRVALMSTQAISGILEGGEPLIVEGQVVGAIGISGGRPAEDGQVLQRGLQALAAR
jgi:uncharacterized protein GlcG (DUF336 family)